jgi:hypothetical protein
MVLNNGKVFFGANDGVTPAQTDLYVLDGTFTPLPSTLLNFSVMRTGTDVLLDWQTQTESNTSHFIIERSNDAVQFSKVGQVTAAGNSADVRNYQFMDYKIVFPASGVLYYRLATYDKDGTKSYSKVVPLYGKSGNWNARLAGNTPGNPVSLQLDGLQKKATVVLTDITGKVLFSRSYDARQWQINLPVNGLAKGMYFVTVNYDGDVKTLQFIR